MCWLSWNLGASSSWNPKGLYRDSFNFTLIFCIVGVFFVTAQCVRSSSALDNLSLYGVFTPALQLASCHFKVCSLQQCPWYPVTAQCVHYRSALDILSLYSVFDPAMPLISFHCTLCSIQQFTWLSITPVVCWGVKVIDVTQDNASSVFRRELNRRESG